jgi:diguanylate cyclase (GGDEF)-like protein
MMITDPDIFNQIAFSFAGHFECVYYVNIETGHYIVFAEDEFLDNSEFPGEGSDFFADAVKNAHVFIHPGDLDLMRKVYDKENVIKNLSDTGNYTVNFRALVGGKVIHMRHIEIMCKDKKHVVFCLENVEREFLEKEEQKKDLMSAELMARRDELTGVKNSNAYKEYEEKIDRKISSGDEDLKIGVVMCDINDLKYINDTMGHNFGDEAIQATSNLICSVFQHSPVFRVGGDEFVVVIKDHDYEHREALLERFREEAEVNRKTRTGPVVASGMAVYEEGDRKLADVLCRADHLMYENKGDLKSRKNDYASMGMESSGIPIPDERRRKLNAMFSALFTVAGGGYIYLNDMRYDFSRWSLSFTDDFGIESEYMYQADKVLLKCIHPDDVAIFNHAVETALRGSAKMLPIRYRARRKDGNYVVLYTRGFIINDDNGVPEYFGGIVIPEEE